MQERAKEPKTEARAGARGKKTDGEQDVLAKIAEMEDPDRTLAEGLHTVVAEHAPQLAPKTWYGMPAYARDGEAVVFFQAAKKCGSLYATLGFSDQANLADGDHWTSAYAVTGRIDEVERRVVELVEPQGIDPDVPRVVHREVRAARQRRAVARERGVAAMPYAPTAHEVGLTRPRAGGVPSVPRLSPLQSSGWLW